MTDKDLIDMLRTKQICTGFKPDGHGDVNVVYGPDPVTAEAADRIEALTAERDRAEDELYELQQTCITLRGENEALTAVQPDAHVNETPKSEHDAGNMLTPATKGGDA